MNEHCTEMHERVVRIEQDLKHTNEKVEKIERDTDAIHEIASSTKMLATSVENMAERLNDVNDKVENVKNGQRELAKKVEEVSLASIKENAAKWKKAVSYVGTALGGAVVAYLISLLFPALGG